MSQVSVQKTWGEIARAYIHPRVITMLFLGFSAGLPILLIFGTLSIWLREADVSRSMVTYFSWAALAYSFKFVWAPIIDRLPLPVLSVLLGRRRAWLLVSQLSIISAIIWMAMSNPAESLAPMAFAAIMLGFSGATQDIVIDAYRIESADTSLQTLMASSYIGGYRLGMLVSGAGALKLAAAIGGDTAYSYSAWQTTYLFMALIMLIGVFTTFVIKEPKSADINHDGLNSTQAYVRFLAMFIMVIAALVATFFYSAEFFTAFKSGVSDKFVLFLYSSAQFMLAVACAWLVASVLMAIGIVKKPVFHLTYIAPMQDFFQRYAGMAAMILGLIALYRVSDIVLGVIANVFYLDLGFDKDQIANVTKIFGVIMSLVGGFIGGALALKFGVLRILFVGALLSAGTNLLFLLLAKAGASMPMLIIVITADNLSAGLAGAAFVAYLSSLTNISFTAMQYAIFSSLMTLFPKILGGYSGSIVDTMGYDSFFIMTALMGMPVLILIYWIGIREDKAIAKQPLE